MNIEERFAHIPEADRSVAVDGFVKINPHLRGIDFDTMMEIVLDSDSHIPLIGDVELDETNCSRLVSMFVRIGHPDRWYSNGIGAPLCTGWMELDTPIGELLAEAGPGGSTEIHNGRVRLWRPWNWSIGDEWNWGGG